MFKALCKSRLQAYTASFLRSDRKGKQRGKGSMIGFGLLFVYVGACFLYLFLMMGMQLAGPLHEAGLSWLYFAIFGIMATGLGVIGSVFTTQSQLYEAKDNELLLSMPIPPRQILGSRMIALYLQNLVMELLVLVPIMAAFIHVAGLSAAGIALSILIMLTLPVLALTLSCILGWLVALIASRMRNKSLITMVLSVGFLLAYFYVFSKMNNYLQMLVVNSGAIAETVQGALFALYQMGLAATGNVMAFVWYFLCIAIPFGLVYWAISVSFLKIATNKRGAARVRYQERQLAVSSPGRALYRKELQHLWASPMYMLNGAFGSVFLVIGAVALLVKRDLVLSLGDLIPGMAGMLPALLALAIATIASMNLITAPSISLEGKTLWIAQGFPVSGWTVLRSKICLQLAVSNLPALLASVAGIVALPMSMLDRALVLVLPQLFSLLCALLGLILNLRFPRFDWTSEAVVVKRGMSVMLTLFAAWAIVLVFWLVYMFALQGVLGLSAYLCVCGAVLALGCLAQYRWLKTKGARIFETLH